jgi:class 3 adenylate cyclase
VVSILSNAPSPHRFSGRPQTPIERNLLPGIARWFAQEVERQEPDFIVPAETKGARVLDAILDYARNELGQPIRVPVLYGTALAYLEPETLRNSRIMIIDDAVRTGRNQDRHRRKIESYGAENVYAVACIGCATGSSAPPATHCYRLVEPDLYREYVWQLTELVVARGLPPEVDHHVFSVRLPARLPLAWEMLKRSLASFGTLTLDGRAASVEDVDSMTLHFPTFAGSAPAEITSGDSVARKVRLFADAGRDELYVVPVWFPSLRLPPGTPEDLDEGTAYSLLRAWTHSDDGLGELLVSRAHRRSPEMLFRAISTCAELELVRGIAQAISVTFDEPISVKTDRELFARLYGADVGEDVAAYVDQALRTEMGPAQFQSRDDGQSPRRPLTLDAKVVETTARIARSLKDLFEKRIADAGHPAEPVGRSFAEIATASGLEDDTLLVSRCLDYGLAMTTLVPYTDVLTNGDGSWRVLRKYRVSELNRDPEEPYEDFAERAQQLAEETLAFIAHYLTERSRRFGGRPCDVAVVSRLAAILRQLIIEDPKIGINARLVDGELVAELRSGPTPQTVLDVTSMLFTIDDSALVPSHTFIASYDSKKLRLDRRGISEELEGYLELVLRAFDAEEFDDADVDTTLTCWAMSTDECLGLSYVHAHLARALDALERPLKVMLRGERHTPAPGAYRAAHAYTEAAEQAIGLLRTDWAATVRASFPRPLRRETRVLESIGAPGEGRPFFDYVSAVGAMVPAVTRLVESLDHASATLWADGPAEYAHGAARAVADSTAVLERTITSMVESGDGPHLPDEPRAATVAAAEHLLRLVGIVRAFIAAFATSYRGSLRGRAVAELEDQRQSTVLFADLAGSTEHALTTDFERNYDWKNRGLNLIAQWGKAFGGYEVKDRSGDDLWLDFGKSGDPAVLCAALIQDHAAALRSTHNPATWWGFRVAIDTGTVRDAAGGNVIGLCIDRAAKLAKARRDAPSLERVWASPEAIGACSPTLREGGAIALSDTEVDLASAVPAAAARFRPFDVDARRLVAAQAAQIAATADEIVQATPKPSTDEIEPRDEADTEDGIGRQDAAS